MPASYVSSIAPVSYNTLVIPHVLKIKIMASLTGMTGSYVWAVGRNVKQAMWLRFLGI